MSNERKGNLAVVLVLTGGAVGVLGISGILYSLVQEIQISPDRNAIIREQSGLEGYDHFAASRIFGDPKGINRFLVTCAQKVAADEGNPEACRTAVTHMQTYYKVEGELSDSGVKKRQGDNGKHLVLALTLTGVGLMTALTGWSRRMAITEY